MSSRDPERRRAWQRDYRERNRARIQANQRRYRQRHIEQLREVQRVRRRTYYWANRAKELAAAAQYRVNHRAEIRVRVHDQYVRLTSEAKERKRARNRAYYWANRDQIHVKQRAFSARNSIRLALRTRTWKQLNLERWHQYERNRARDQKRAELRLKYGGFNA